MDEKSLCQCYYKLYDIEDPNSFVVGPITRRIKQIESAMLRRGLRNQEIGTEIEHLLAESRNVLLDIKKEEDYRNSRVSNHDCNRILNLIYYIKTDLLPAEQRVERNKKVSIKERDNRIAIELLNDEQSSESSESSSTSDQVATVDKIARTAITLEEVNCCNQITEEIGQTPTLNESGLGDELESQTLSDGQEEKLHGYHRVKSIVDCRIGADGSREFRIGWYGQSDTWEPETHLDGCIDLLRTFLLMNPQFGEQTNLQPLLGIDCRKALKIDERNLVSADTLLQTIRSFSSNKTYRVGLEVEILDSKRANPDKDRVYIYLSKRHCYVLLFRAKERLVLLSDGSNTCLDDPAPSKAIERLLGQVKIVKLEFIYQSGADHCASSAVSISLEFMRLYKDRAFLDEHGWPRQLQVPTKTHRKIVQQLHKYPSTRMYGRDANLVKRVFPRCKLCNKAFQTTNRRSIKLHELACRKKYTKLNDK